MSAGFAYVNPRFRAKFLQIVGAGLASAYRSAAGVPMVTYKPKSSGVDRAV